MLHPAAVIIVAVLVTSIIMIFVIPRFQELFSSFGSDLRRSPRCGWRCRSGCQWWWMLLFIAIATVYVFSYVWKRSRKFRHSINKNSC